MNWSLAFEPLLSWPWLAARPRADRAAGAGRPVLRASAARWLRFAGARRAGRGAGQPGPAGRGARAAEERRRRSSSTAARARTSATARPRPTRRLPACRSGWRASRSSTSASSRPARPTQPTTRTATRLFGALDSAFRDVPPSRIAGAVMITDGQVHDVPCRRRSAFQAPLHALITGEEGEMRPPHPRSRTRRASASSASRCR